MSDNIQFVKAKNRKELAKKVDIARLRLLV